MKHFATIGFLLFITMSCQGENESRFRYKFGILKLTLEQTYILEKETKVIPLIPNNGRDFHGLIVIPRDDAEYSVYRIYHFPSPPQSLGHIDGGGSVEEGGYILRTPVEVMKGAKVLPASFHPNDPLGEYRLDLYINDNLIDTIKYEVVAPES